MDLQTQQVVYVTPDTSRRRAKAFGFGAISLISGVILIVISLVVSEYYIYTGVLIFGIVLVIKGIVFIIYGFRLYRQAQNPDPSQAACIVVTSGTAVPNPYPCTGPYPPVPVAQQFGAPQGGNASYPQQQYVTQTQFQPSYAPPGGTPYPQGYAPAPTPAGTELPPPYVEPK